MSLPFGLMPGAHSVRKCIPHAREKSTISDTNNLDTANALAETAGMRRPFPRRIPTGKDNGETFLFDYYLNQHQREKKYDYTKRNMLFCPCEECTDRRAVCPCVACSMFRDDNDGDPLSPSKFLLFGFCYSCFVKKTKTNKN